MRRAAIGSIAVLSTACASRPFTPAVSVAYWAQEVPAPTPTPLPLAAEAIRRWQLPPDDPWARYSKMTLLASLDGSKPVDDLPHVRDLSVVHQAEAAAASVAQLGLPADTMWVVDMRGAASVAFAASLSSLAKEPVSPVLTFNNWPSDNELIPAEETLAALVTMYPSLPTGRGPGRPVFLLDAWRLAYRFDQPGDDVVDNRYILNASDLPDAATLHDQGIRRVLYLVEDLDDTDTEEDDLNEVMRSYQQAGITLHMVDLAWLMRRDLPPVWHEALGSQTIVIEQRSTIVADPHFYARSRGGFGGIHTGPSPFRPGTSFSGGG